MPMPMHKHTQPPMHTHAPRPIQLALLLLLPLTACGGGGGGGGGGGETPVATAKPGDTLVRSGQERVVLERAFRPGQPNGLYKGIVKVSSPQGAERRLEVNGVCSMPGLQSEGWPAYDNLYGRRLGASGGSQGSPDGGESFQVLFHFDGRVEAGKAAAEQAWLSRLRDNLCRRGSFDDRKK
jgi:hypothetical protein